MDMKYWDLTGNVATLKREVMNVNHKKVNFRFNNVTMSGIRFLISTEPLLLDSEKSELLFVI